MGVKALLVKVEADVTEGLPVFRMVGYLGSEVKEAADRVRSSVKNTGYAFKSKKSDCESFAGGYKKKKVRYSIFQLLWLF